MSQLPSYLKGSQSSQTEVNKKVDIDSLEMISDDECEKKAKTIGLSNEREQQYVIVAYTSKGRKVRTLIVTAKGVLHLCRSRCKEVLIPDYPHIDYFQGHPRNVVVKCRIVTNEGKTFEALGSKDVQGSFEVAVKHSETNATMRALVKAFGFDAYDETETENLTGKKESSP